MPLATLVLVLAVPAAAQEPPPREARIERLERVLDYGLWNGRIQALYEAGEMGRDGLPLLQRASDDADWQVRLTVTHFLGKLGPAAAPDLAALARAEPCPNVRLSALRWLERMDARAELASALTPEDRRELDGEPDRYGTERMGKPLVIDAPEGDMTPEFFAGGPDFRACASSEHSGRKHARPRVRPERRSDVRASDDPEVRTPPAPAAPAAAPGSTPWERVGTPESFPPGEPGFDRAKASSSSGARAERVERRREDLDKLVEPGAREGFPPGPPAPERPAAAASAPRYEAADAREPAPRTVVPPREAAAPETLPPGPAAPVHEAPAAGTADFVADAGTGRPEDDPVPRLVEALSGPDARRRARAADELGKRGEAALPAVPALRRALSDRDRRVRASAALALGDVGGTSAETAAAVRRALRDKDEDVRFSAALALQRLSRPR